MFFTQKKKSLEVKHDKPKPKSIPNTQFQKALAYAWFEDRMYETLSFLVVIIKD